MLHIVFDLEATCWKNGTTPRRMETIEIGAARLEPGTYEISDTFGTFVKPVEEPVLSGFCRDLTSICQADVDEAPMFLEALGDFLRWAGNGDITFCSWGAYDMKQIAVDCGRHDIETPAVMSNHINLKALFAELRDRKPCGMRRALNILGLPLTGTHHRGADDAVNIARIAKVILPEYYGDPVSLRGRC